MIRSVSCGEIVDDIDGTANVFTVSFLDKDGVEIAGYNPADKDRVCTEY